MNSRGVVEGEMVRSRQPMTVETRDAILAEIAGDGSFQSIGEAFGFNVSTIRRLARANGFNGPRKYHAVKISPQRQSAAERRDALAEHMAEGGSFTQFARDAKMTLRGVEYMWAKIRAGLGAQAV